MAKPRRAPEDAVRRRPDDEDDDDTPRRRGRRDDDDDDSGDDGPVRPRRKRKSASGPVKLILRIFVCVALAVGLVILLYWVYTPVGTDYALLCYFPPETTQLTGYDAGEAARNGKMKDVHETLLSNYKIGFSEKRFTQECGVVPGDVDKYLSGVASGNPDEEKDLAPQDRRGGLTVIRFNRDVDQAKFIGSFTGYYKVEERKSKDGKTYQQVYTDQKWVTDHNEREDDISFFFPNSKTLVYGTTRRETEEAIGRQPGRIAVKGEMRELADDVDGMFFQASAGWNELVGFNNAMAYRLNFVDESVRNPRSLTGVTGSASWFASNGNEFLYASATLYADKATANDVKQKLRSSYDKTKQSIAGSEGGRANVEDPFHPKVPAGAKGFVPGAVSSDQTKDIVEALNEYVKYSRVYSRGRMVVVEGTIPHGMPETGVFEKFWAAVSSNYRLQQHFGGGFPGAPPGMPGAAGMPGPPVPGRP